MSDAAVGPIAIVVHASVPADPRIRRQADALVGAGYETAGKIIGGIAFVATAFVLYRWVLGMAAKRSA